MKHLQGLAVDEDDQIVDEDGNVYVPEDENEDNAENDDQEQQSENEQTENETDTENAE